MKSELIPRPRRRPPGQERPSGQERHPSARSDGALRDGPLKREGGAQEDDRQRLKQLDVALQTIATQATRKLRLAAGEFGKALAWFERGATAEKLNTNAQLDSALKVEKSEKQKIELLKAQINIRVHGYGWACFNTAWPSSTDKTVGTVADLARRVKQIFSDEKAEKPRPPSEPPVPDTATNHLKALGC